MPALSQISATGIQDLPLVSSPEITFWTVEYKRHSNFAMESIENNFQQTADFGRKASCLMQRVGDLAYRVYLQVTLPEVSSSAAKHARWLDYIGEHLIAEAEVQIGGQKIDRQYGEWIHIWNQLTLPLGQRKNYHKMIGHTTQLTYITDPSFADVAGPCASGSGPAQVCAPRNALPETTLYIPLTFWFCLNPGLALPIVALPFHEIKIDITFRPLGECLWAVSSLTASADSVKSTSGAYSLSLVAASLYVDYIFLDVDERTIMAKNPHEYLINQLQYSGEESVGSSSHKIKLNFSHPVRELIFVVQPDANVDYCSSLIGGTALYKVLGAQPFNFTDAIDALPRAIHAFGSEAATSGATEFLTSSGTFETAGALELNTAASAANWGGAGAANLFGEDAPQGSLVSDAGTYVLAETARDLHCWGENPVVTCVLKLNGQDRFSVREGSYFDRVQHFQHHTNAGDDGINIYSFALKPEEYAPSGACNFSRMDNAELHVVLSSNAVSGTNTAKARVYALNTNQLQITNGMAGIKFAS
ncbi:MAG: major capsid protein [Vampirovibrionales bacterium]|nr:major capsid protein [Vampirovibrionales bacterium]